MRAKCRSLPTDSLVEVREYEVEDRRGAVAEAVRFSALFCVVFCVAQPNPECPPDAPHSPLPPVRAPTPARLVPLHQPLQLEFRNTYQAEVEKERRMLMQQRQAQTANPWAESSMPTFAPAADGPQPTVAGRRRRCSTNDSGPSRRASSAPSARRSSRRRETPEVKYTRVQDVPGTPAEPPLEQQAPDRDDRLTPIVHVGQGRGAAGAEPVAPLPTMTNGGGALGGTSGGMGGGGGDANAAMLAMQNMQRMMGGGMGGGGWAAVDAERHAGRRHAGRHAERHAVAADGRRRDGRDRAMGRGPHAAA